MVSIFFAVFARLAVYFTRHQARPYLVVVRRRLATVDEGVKAPRVAVHVAKHERLGPSFTPDKLYQALSVINNSISANPLSDKFINFTHDCAQSLAAVYLDHASSSHLLWHGKWMGVAFLVSAICGLDPRSSLQSSH